MRFESCYAMPLCAPIRTVLITGCYGFRTGGLTNETGHLPRPEQEPSFARVLKQAGYATCQVGKWRHTCATPKDSCGASAKESAARLRDAKAKKTPRPGLCPNRGNHRLFTSNRLQR
jgi:arylsulfatase A-like enzyme